MAGAACARLGAAGRIRRAGGPGARRPPLPTPINPDDRSACSKPFVWRSIGPANMGGRIDDIAVVESNPSIIYVGLRDRRHLEDASTTARPGRRSSTRIPSRRSATSPSRRRTPTSSTSAPASRTTARARRSAPASTSRSTRGKTFEYVGLEGDAEHRAASSSIRRIPNIVYVAAVGHLFGPNPERGLYKTIDGGKTWTNTKFIDKDTGFTDVVMDPSNPNVLYAASYQRRRAPWGFNGGGPGSGIWKTTDGGKDVDEADGQRPADQSDHRPHRPRHRALEAVDDLRVDRSRPERRHRRRRQRRRNAASPARTRCAAAAAAAAADAAASARSDEDRHLAHRTTAARRGSSCRTDGDRSMYYSQIRVDPTNPEIAYQGGAPFFKTVDGGKTWRQVQGLAHSDHHAIWIDPKNSNHLIVGNDGGLDVTLRPGARRGSSSTPCAVGQFYAISADMRKPYYVCGGLQDNGSWCGPSATRSANGILNSDWYRVGGGDGFYTANDPTDWTILYSESQDGATNRSICGAGRAAASGRAGPSARQAARQPAGCRERGSRTARCRAARSAAAPTRTATSSRRLRRAPSFRFYWNTPFILSPHNPRTVYLGARSAVPLVRPRRHVDGVARSDEQHRPQRSADHGRRRQGADGLEARRRRVVQQHHHDQRIAGRAGHRSGSAPTTATCR